MKSNVPATWMSPNNNEEITITVQGFNFAELNRRLNVAILNTISSTKGARNTANITKLNLSNQLPDNNASSAAWLSEVSVTPIN